MTKKIVVDGPHTTEALSVMPVEIDEKGKEVLRAKAMQIIEHSADAQNSKGKETKEGLLYGLIQSGKTSVMSIAAVMALDNGYQILIVLTSDNNLLYIQTLERVKRILRGVKVMEKDEWEDSDKLSRLIRTAPFAIVCSKNGRKLKSLYDALEAAGCHKLSTYIIDDEADQASLNTKASKANEEVSTVNDMITKIRDFFYTNTYLQVTATPQALFQQRPNHRYRPSFTVLSEPGKNYIGGESFFSEDSKLLRYVDLEEVNSLLVSKKKDDSEPVNRTLPDGMKRAIHTFLVGATSGVIASPQQSYAFLCHISYAKLDHKNLVELIDMYKEEIITGLSNDTPEITNLLKEAYDDLLSTQPNLPKFSSVIAKMKFYLPGASIKLINATTSDEVVLDAVFNFFVGGNKLGRGVTINNLLVSYYGRNPKRPTADTVLQHARMYGYRQKDLGITKLFLPERLAEHFRLIHQMETALRELIRKNKNGQIEGLYIHRPLRSNRATVVEPNSIGYYVAGSSYNPMAPLRTAKVVPVTEKLDKKMESYNEKQQYSITIDLIIELIKAIPIDTTYISELWDEKMLIAALEEIKTLKGNDAYLIVLKGRGLRAPRGETRGILSGGEKDLAQSDKPTLFMVRQNKKDNEEAAWWPQIRLPDGNYVLAFSLKRK